LNELRLYLEKLNYKDKNEIDRYLGLFELYMENILRNNEKINVTSIKDRKSFISKHYIDSVSIINENEFLQAKNIIDIGTGGGFPGVPLAILFPDKKFTLVDSVAKKINVIKDSIKDFPGDNIDLVIGRAETIGRMPAHRQVYDLCVSRAVAPLEYLLEFAIPLVKPGGSFIAYKGPVGRNEIKNSEFILRKMGASLNRIEEVQPFLDGGDHILMVFSKDKSTPEEYPRRMDQIKRIKK
jgi:16S rRNA (guanine527-N7)-methyltransferase